MMRRLLQFYLLAIASAAAANAQDRVTVRVVSTSGSPVASQVSLRVGQAEDKRPTGPDGMVTFEPVSCTASTMIRVAPNNPFFADIGNWRPCSANLLVTLRPLSFSAALNSLVEAPGGGSSQLAALPAGGHKGAELQSTLHAASAVGDWGRMTFAATELAKLQAAAGHSETAAQYQGIAALSGLQLIALQQGKDISEPLLAVAPNGKLVETEEAKRLLESFQAEKGLRPTGRWNSATAQAVQR